VEDARFSSPHYVTRLQHPLQLIQPASKDIARLKHQGAKSTKMRVVLIGLAVLCVVFGAALLFGLQ